MFEKVKLPPGYSVRQNSVIGFDFLNESGVIVLQHPYDSDAARRLVWEIYSMPVVRVFSGIQVGLEEPPK